MIYFILGILFSYLVLPLIQNIISIANIKTQEYSYIVSERVAKIQKNIQSLNLEEQQEEDPDKLPFGFQSTSAVGFEIDNEQIQEGEYE